jgi:hypothetical protein
MRSKMLQPKCLGKLWLRRRRRTTQWVMDADYALGSDRSVICYMVGGRIVVFDGYSRRQLNMTLNPAPMKLFGGQHGGGKTAEAMRSLSEVCRELRDGPGPPGIPIKFDGPDFGQISSGILSRGYWDAAEGPCSICGAPSVYFMDGTRLCKLHRSEYFGSPMPVVE